MQHLMLRNVKRTSYRIHAPGARVAWRSHGRTYTGTVQRYDSIGRMPERGMVAVRCDQSAAIVALVATDVEA